jgi:hypothetical protein
VGTQHCRRGHPNALPDRWLALLLAIGLLAAILTHSVLAKPLLSVTRFWVYFPFLSRREACQPIPGETYIALSADGPGPHIPAEVHPDLNLAVHGYEPTNAYKGLVDYPGPHDPNAPQFHDLFADRRLPTFHSVYQLYGWDWAHMRRGPLITDPPVTVLGLGAAQGETLHVPDSGYTIGSGFEVLVLYASSDRITLKYTREDNVVSGYTLHVDRICVEPSLLALYQACNHAGRAYLPALRPRQAFGRALGDEVVIAIVDSGTFLDPRSRQDWWRAH